MFSRLGFRSLALAFLVSNTIATIDLDTNNQDSIKSVAKTLASGIISIYNESQRNEPIPGLFSDPYYWWEAGAVWGGLIEYAHLTGDNQYNDLVTSAMLHQIGDYNAFMPQNQTKTLGNDDQSSWGLAAMTAAETDFEKPGNEVGEWVDLATNVFDIQTERWNTDSCAGGLKWQIFSFNNGFNYRNSISTGNFFLLAARLAQYTGNATYSEWAEKALKWTQDIGLVTEDFHVFDGTDDRNNCSTINRIQWTLNTAVFAEGAATMFNLTNGDNKWRDAAAGFVNATSFFQRNGTSVLTEVACEWKGMCNVDQRAFKGIAIRSLARAAQAAPFTSASINRIIEASAKSAAMACESDDDDVQCALSWTEQDSDTRGGLGEAHNALQAVSALLWPQAKALERQNSTTSGTSSSSSPTGDAAPQQTNAPGAAGSLASSPIFLSTAAILALLCL